MNTHHKWVAAYVADGLKVTYGVVIGFADHRQYGHYRHGCHQQGVSIWHGFGNRVGRNTAACTQPVFNHHGLS